MSKKPIEPKRIKDGTKVMIMATKFAGVEGEIVGFSGGTEGTHKIRFNLWTTPGSGERIGKPIQFEEWFIRKDFAV